MKYLLYTLIQLSLLTHPIYSMNSPTKTGAFQNLKSSFKERKNLNEVHPIIKEEIIKAFDICGITEPIIILQNEHSTNSGVYPLTDELGNHIKALVIGVADDKKNGEVSLGYIKHSIYHECGHIVNGDVYPESRIKGALTLGAILGLNLISGKNIYNITKQVSKSVGICSGILGGIVTTGFSLTAGVAIKAAHWRPKELNADIFAIRTLIKQNDFEPIIISFLDLTFSMDEGMSNYKNEPDFLHDHPPYKERAHQILIELRHANIDFKNLPLANASDFSKEYLQQKFEELVGKYFPEYL